MAKELKYGAEARTALEGANGSLRKLFGEK